MGKVLEHKHTIIRAELELPPHDTEEIKSWMLSLVKAINMNVLMGPYAVYSEMKDNRGLTAFTIIETSHIAIHSWDEVSPALCQLDVYTCSTLDLEKVFLAIKNWKPTKIEYDLIDRENGLARINSGSVDMEKYYNGN